MKKKFTQKQRKLRTEYSKQRSRILKFLKGAEQRGYLFEKKPIIKELKEIKRVTPNMIEKLINITPQSLYETAKYVSELTFGEIVSAKEGRTYERKASAKKARITIKEREEYEEIPSFSVVDRVREKLGVVDRIQERLTNLSTNLEYGLLVKFVMDSRDTFLSIFEDNLQANEEAYIKWLTDNETAINEQISKIEYYDSGTKGVANKLENSRSELMKLLNMGSFPLFYDNENDYT